MLVCQRPPHVQLARVLYARTPCKPYARYQLTLWTITMVTTQSAIQNDNKKSKTNRDRLLILMHCKFTMVLTELSVHPNPAMSVEYYADFRKEFQISKAKNVVLCVLRARSNSLYLKILYRRNDFTPSLFCRGRRAPGGHCPPHLARTTGSA